MNRKLPPRRAIYGPTEKALDLLPILIELIRWTVKYNAGSAAAISCAASPKIVGFNDEALSGEWKGYRSSRLGLQWCVIYRVVTDALLIQVVHVTPHDYRRP